MFMTRINERLAAEVNAIVALASCSGPDEDVPAGHGLPGISCTSCDDRNH